MYFPRFLVGATVTLLFIAGWVYQATGSVWQAVAWAVLAAIILQVGYFVAIALLVHLGASKNVEIIESSDGEEGRSLPIGRDRMSL